MTTVTPTLDFVLPEGLERGQPLAERDAVRLMVGWRSSLDVEDSQFRRLGHFLRRGDALVINTSATVPAAVDAWTDSGEEVVVHFSSRLPDGTWTVEVRLPGGIGSRPYPEFAGGTLLLPDGGRVEARFHHPTAHRLWVAHVDLRGGDVGAFLAHHGRPIRYAYTKEATALEAYQTVYGRHLGSAEMPSAGRPFTAGMITDLVAEGVVLVPIVLHAGVASLEEGEHPAAEYFSVPVATAAVVNAARAAGGRVIAVGTTVVRALESAVGDDDRVAAAEGHTELVVSPQTELRAVDGLLTGWHEPKASHLELVAAVAGRPLLELLYRRAVDLRYAWHEFGDSCLILP